VGEISEWGHKLTTRRQIPLIILAALAATLTMLPLELQRHIINSLAGREKADTLLLLCTGYLAATWSISELRYLLNTRSAGLGESAILSLRRDIHATFSPLSSRRLGNADGSEQAGTFVAMISSEAEAVGKLVGECISTPVVQVGTLTSVLGYMLWTQPDLGLIVLLIAVPQVLVAPLVQRRINALVKMRVRELRHAGDGIVDEMRAGASERATDVLQSFARIFGLRLRVFRLKFGLKLTVNGLQSLGVFILLLVGGTMVLRGRTEIGIVVAFISGLDRIVDPLRELIAFLRSTSVAKVQYDMIEETLGRRLHTNSCG
jgi:ABC-type bacteriocin/lantibiotic exporter with double-glycine peptidase domain